MKLGAMKRISEKKLETVFSLFIRRIGYCERCYRRAPYVILQCSHFHTRAARSVRFEPLNADCLCMGCHKYLENRKTVEYRDWKIKKLGTRRFKKLEHMYRTLKRGGFTESEKQAMLKRFT